MNSVSNEAGIVNARVGIYNGEKSVFTHRNPDTGMIWGEDLKVRYSNGHYDLGRWVPSDSVEWL